MTIWTINLYVFIAALAITFLLRQIRKPENLLIEILKNFIGAYFIFSGVIKAVDPTGTAIKMEEYFEIFINKIPIFSGLWKALGHQALVFSMLMIIGEIYLGFALILGAFRKVTVWLLLLLIVFFTFLTGYSHRTGQVTDCGCFGDFIKLTPQQSFYKDIILTVLILPLVFKWNKISTLFPKAPRYWALFFLTLGAIVFAYRNIYYEPIFDFRPYKNKVNIEACLKLPPNAKPYKYETSFLYKNNQTGEIKEFKYEDLMKINYDVWAWDSTITKMTQKGDDPKCKDFDIVNAEKASQMNLIMNLPEMQFLIIIPKLDKTDVGAFEDIAKFVENAKKNKSNVKFLTGSSIADVEEFLSSHNIENCEVFNTDETPLKTAIRSNPGLIVLKKGTILGKYHHHDLPSYKEVVENADEILNN